MYYIKSKATKMWIKGQQEDRYYAKLFRGETVTLDALAKEISHSTSLSEPDVLAALKAFQIHVQAHVMGGEGVALGDLGYIFPKIKSQAVPSADEVTAETIKKVSARYYPSVKFKTALKSATLQEKVLPTA
jgi:predicted histone-like DNA-binding protein